eukprot:gene11578-biopygen18409
MYPRPLWNALASRTCCPASRPREKRPRPRPVRVRFFGFYRAPRVRSASAAVSPSAATQWGHPAPAAAGTLPCRVCLFGLPLPRLTRYNNQPTARSDQDAGDRTGTGLQWMNSGCVRVAAHLGGVEGSGSRVQQVV